MIEISENNIEIESIVIQQEILFSSKFNLLIVF